MAQPKAEPIDEKDVRNLALELVLQVKFPVLATVDTSGHPRVRPVSPVRTDGFTIYVANLRQYQKTREIAANPKVELCYTSSDHDQVRISGCASILENQEVILSIWAENPLLRHYLGNPDNPNFLIYVIRPERVRFMKEWALNYYEVPL